MRHCFYTLLFLLFINVLCCRINCQPTNFTIGINLCGAEFGNKKLPGILNQDYIYPSENDIKYFAKKGFKIMTLPFKWERIQLLPSEELDSLELSEIKQFITRCNKYNVQVTLTMQNFAALNQALSKILRGSFIIS